LVDAVEVDFHNQRLRTVVAKPYDSEAERVHRAVAIAQWIIDVLGQTGEDADHPSAKVRVGIDSGKALANSRRQDASSIYADIDGFTAFVSRSISPDDKAKHFVCALHVPRSEIDAVLPALPPTGPTCPTSHRIVSKWGSRCCLGESSFHWRRVCGRYRPNALSDLVECRLDALATKTMMGEVSDDFERTC